ncbi:glycosyltransferase family 4 protein [Cryobacterium sp. Hh38]|uniref:glycosyltransferase family 4 protein n=1 Tax=Cryobacterium sp. Hh38 TaxID=1259156 RepID=UPI00141AC215|nr:glycosyltransferase family 4 protein [Cryobacterium sp. Hh38]
MTADISLTLMRGFPEYLRDAGWEVHIVSTPGPVLTSLSGLNGVITHSLPMERQPSPVKDVLALAAWLHLLRKVRPDIVSVGTPKAGLLGGIASLLARVPERVYLLRGLRLETAHGFQRWVLLNLERLSLSTATQILAVSPSLRQRVISLGLVAPGKVRVLGHGSSNGVDLAAFSPTKISHERVASLATQLGIISDIPVVGFVGRLTHDKGLADLAVAREILTKRNIDHQILLVGEIDEGQDQDILVRLQAAGRPVVATGYVSNPIPYYCLMDVLCLPTLREGFPNVVLEAGASGLPTVTTNATGAVDSVIDGQTGLIAQVGDSRSLANKLEKLLLDPTSRSVMGSAAKAHVSKNFDRNLVWANLAEFFKSLGPQDVPTQRELG